MTPAIEFHATPEDERIINAAIRDGERAVDVIRRALRLLWLEQARYDMVRLAAEDLTREEDAW